MNVVASPDGLALITLVKEASLPVQLVMLMLLLASFMSWTMIFRKWFQLRNARIVADRFEQRFWSGGSLMQIHAEFAKGKNPVGMENLFLMGFREYKRLSSQSNMQPTEMVEGVQRAMRVALSREIDGLEMYLPFLATVGSVSPYVGLFGTVWGIMNSFRSLGAVQQPTIGHVAPGIAEALIATAIGLFAAIPAVIAYNRYSNHVERLVTRYEAFMDEFTSVLHRQSFTQREK